MDEHAIVYGLSAEVMLLVGYALAVVSVHLQIAPFAAWGTEGSAR